MNDTNDIYEGMSEEDLTAQADALLAAADAAEDTTGAKKKTAKNSKKGEDSAEAAPEKKYAPLDEKLIASLPAAALLEGSEKLRDLFAKGRSKHRLESGELMEVLDEMELDGGQMDLIYDSLEQLNIEVNTPELIDNEDALDGEPPLEVIAEIEEEELVDPNELVDSFSIDDPVRMYLKEIG
ncbi:MAG: RNA polymerase sigma factor region1.1 domain-containing protein, partial [Oscillospiraceae bacterium]|nr:RNA polymerase sigma factor region1.1 domain-containing protein [Oscillospiraceae bacterium]